jgi:hypothetical protein
MCLSQLLWGTLKWANRLGAAIAYVFFLASLIARYILGLTNNDKLAAGFGIAVLGAIVWQLVHLVLRVESVNKQLKEQRRGELLTLANAVSDLFANLERHAVTKTISINVIALHFENMIKSFERKIRQGNTQSINLQILLLTPDVESLGKNVPTQVAKACSIMKMELELRKNSLKKLVEDLQQVGRKLTVSIKYYAYEPTLVGFFVVKPVDVSYVSFCRYTAPNDFLFADLDYHRVYHHSATAADNDLLLVLRGMFEHCWELEKKPEWVYPLQKLKTKGRAKEEKHESLAQTAEGRVSGATEGKSVSPDQSVEGSPNAIEGSQSPAS